MKLKKMINMGVIAMSILALSACSNHRNPANAQGSTYESGGVDDAVLNGQGLAGEGTFIGADGKPMTTQQLLAIRTYHFTYDSAEILPVDRQAVIVQAHYLSSHPNQHILLAGNTDARGSREYNIALGWRRAQSVEDLMLLHGVKKSQIQLVSYGEEKPVAFGDSEQAYQENRRVDLTDEN
jgi:peptidoglycan-associated lipoprotein